RRSRHTTSRRSARWSPPLRATDRLSGEASLAPFSKTGASVAFHRVPLGRPQWRAPTEELLPASCQGGNLLVAEAARQVVVDHAGRLHVRVHDRAADEAEAALPEVLRERVGFLRG